MFEYSFSVRHEGCWTADIQQTFPNFEATILESHAFSDSSSTIIEITNIGSKTIDDLESWFEAHPIIRTVERYKREANGGLIGLQTDFSESDTEPVGKVFREQPCIPLSAPTVSDGLEHCHLMLPSREIIQTTYNELRKYGPVTIESLSELDSNFHTSDLAAVSRAIAELSPRQQQTLRRAINSGYYEVPQECNIEDLADEDAVTMSTVAEHLRNAEYKIFTAIAPLLDTENA